MAEEDARKFLDDIQSLFTGHDIQRMVARSQETLEVMRPMPVEFETKFHLMEHLLPLVEITAAPEISLHGPDKVMEYVDYYKQKAIREISENWRAKATMAEALSISPQLSNAREDLSWKINSVDRILRSSLGNGDLLLGWERAWAMTRDGLEGGIRSLRSLIIKEHIREMTRVGIAMARARIDEFPRGERDRFRKRISDILLASDLTSPDLSPLHIFAMWDRTVGQYIEVLHENYLPRELA